MTVVQLPRRSRSSRLFWGALGLAAHSVSRVWPRARSYEPVIERISLPIAHLPAGLRGLTIAHLSDFHVGRHVKAEHVRHVAQQTMALRPELIALTGDFVDRNVKYSRACAEALSILHAPLGVHVVLGNHDYWTNATLIEADLRRVGLAPLHNQSRHVERGGDSLYVVGIDDVRGRKADFDQAVYDVPPDDVKLLLVHEPDFADYIPAGRCILQLSGHSHGGQIRIPRLGALMLPTWGRKYASGLYRARNGMWVYTTRGIGLAMPPVRINCPAEITLLTLETEA